MEKEIRFANCLTVDVKVFEQELSSEHTYDSIALSVLECLEDKVSDDLVEKMKKMLLGFDEAMQLEIADDLLDFTHGHAIHTTGCPSADYILDICYALIAVEQGILNKEGIMNMMKQK